METHRITLKIVGLNKHNAATCEAAVLAMPGVLQCDTWPGKIEIIASTETTTENVRRALQDTGFPVQMHCQSCEATKGSGTAGTLWRAAGLLGVVVLVSELFARTGVTELGVQMGQATTFLAAVLLGLVAGSSACIAVSGGLLLSSTAVLRARYGHLGWWGKMRPVLSFVLGRVAGYALFGALIGVLGAAFSPSPQVTGGITLVAAITMVMIGIDMLGLAPAWLKRLTPRMPNFISKHIANTATRTSGYLAPFTIGASTFFLPCGFTQSLQIYALTTGDAVHSALLLAGFAMGTMPALILVGAAATSVKGNLGKWFFGFSGALVLFLGISNVQNGLTLLGHPIISPTVLFAKMAQEQTVFPPIIEGKQIIHMDVGGAGAIYSPDAFTVRAGVPVQWEVEGKSLQGCISVLQSQQLGINQPLTLGKNIIEFTPKTAGTFSFSCSMGMYRGTVRVVPNNS